MVKECTMEECKHYYRHRSTIVWCGCCCCFLWYSSLQSFSVPVWSPFDAGFGRNFDFSLSLGVCLSKRQHYNDDDDIARQPQRHFDISRAERTHTRIPYIFIPNALHCISLSPKRNPWKFMYAQTFKARIWLTVIANVSSEFQIEKLM